MGKAKCPSSSTHSPRKNPQDRKCQQFLQFQLFMMYSCGLQQKSSLPKLGKHCCHGKLNTDMHVCVHHTHSHGLYWHCVCACTQSYECVCICVQSCVYVSLCFARLCLLIYVLLYCIWVLVHCMFFFNKVVKLFESLKALCEFLFIIITIMIITITVSMKSPIL